MNNTTLLLDPSDNVGVALSNLESGQKVSLNKLELEIQEFVAAKHKFAIQDLAAGDDILMYGTIVGEATQAIPKGYPITLGNIQHKTRQYDINLGHFTWTPPDISEWKNKTFNGYIRPDNQVGTANYWLVLPLVFCENTNIKLLQEAFENALGFSSPNPYELHIKKTHFWLKSQKYTETVAEKSVKTSSRIFENIDGIRFLTHDLGCGGTRQDSETLCVLLAGYINHPNVAGATVLSLGCQNAQASILLEKLSLIQKGRPKPVIICDQQQEGTTDQLIKKSYQ